MTVRPFVGGRYGRVEGLACTSCSTLCKAQAQITFDSTTCSRPGLSQVVSLVLPQLGELQIGNLALKELLVPQLTQFMIAIQNGLG